MSNPSLQILVYGAAGHTGRFVVAELIARGHRPIMAGRDRDKLAALGVAADIRVAALDDPAELDAAFADCAGVINCAGPFLDTAKPVIEAALRAGVPYLDIAAEQAYAFDAFERFGAAARQARVPVMPSMAFYGGLADLLATAVMADWPEADAIEISIALDSWRPTEGTLATGRRNTIPRVMRREGQLQPIATPAPLSQRSFPPPFGDQEVVELSFTETALISSHLKTGEVVTLFTTKPLADLRDPAMTGPTPVDATGRSAQIFLVDCRVRRGGESRRGWLSGQDIYAMTAPLIVSAAERLVGVTTGGVFAPGELFNARAFLASLTPGTLQVSLDQP